jgi:hypothetical protein
MRFPRTFYREFDDHRAAYGDTEYDVQVMLAAFLPTLDKYLTGEADQARTIKMDMLTEIESRKTRAENAGDPNQTAFYFFDAHTPLGDRQRIKRGHMTSDHVFRRKLVIDENRAAQDISWADETKWLNRAATALRGHAPDTKLQDVLTEEGTPVRAPTPV